MSKVLHEAMSDSLARKESMRNMHISTCMCQSGGGKGVRAPSTVIYPWQGGPRVSGNLPLGNFFFPFGWPKLRETEQNC